MNYNQKREKINYEMIQTSPFLTGIQNKIRTKEIVNKLHEELRRKIQENLKRKNVLTEPMNRLE